MIDKLLSNPDALVNKLHLKGQKDGKIVDHIYRHQGFIHDERDIFYIGDSKYYSSNGAIGQEAIYKQYTYARNVIQANLNVFNSDPDAKEGRDYLEYRDEITEGYNITPNFFIRAHVPFKDSEGNPQEVSYDDDDLKFLKSQKPNIHFKNRLFDRDTLLLQHYSINFLFVLALYGSSDEYAQSGFRKKARKLFREKIIEDIATSYDFFSLKLKSGATGETAKAELRDVVDSKYFRKLLGKAFLPYNDEDFVYLSLDKDAQFLENNLGLLADLSHDFTIRNYKLGTDPRDELQELTYATIKARKIAGNQNSAEVSTFAEFDDEIFLVGGYRADKPQEEWILNNCAYNVRMQNERHGQVLIDQNVMSAQFLILYSINNLNAPVRIYKINGKRVKNQEEMTDLNYPDPKGVYMLFNLDPLEYKFEQLDLAGLFSHQKRTQNKTSLTKSGDNSDLSIWDGSPLFVSGSMLKSHSLNG